MAENSAKYSVVITSNTSKLDELKSFLTAMCGVEDLSHKTCPICKKVFASPANRDRHVKRMHQTNISHSTQKNRQNREKNEENIQPDTTINEIVDLIKNQGGFNQLNFQFKLIDLRFVLFRKRIGFH